MIENLKILLKTDSKNDIILRYTNFMYTVNIFRSSSVVEQSAVNRRVVGSNPTCGAIKGKFRWSKFLNLSKKLVYLKYNILINI